MFHSTPSAPLPKYKLGDRPGANTRPFNSWQNALRFSARQPWEDNTPPSQQRPARGGQYPGGRLSARGHNAKHAEEKLMDRIISDSASTVQQTTRHDTPSPPSPNAYIDTQNNASPLAVILTGGSAWLCPATSLLPVTLFRDGSSNPRHFGEFSSLKKSYCSCGACMAPPRDCCTRCRGRVRVEPHERVRSFLPRQPSLRKTAGGSPASLCKKKKLNKSKTTATVLRLKLGAETTEVHAPELRRDPWTDVAFRPRDCRFLPI